MLQYWNLREPREKILILVAGVLSLLVLAWFGIIGPLYQANVNARKDLQQAMADKDIIEQSLAGFTFEDRVLLGAATDFDAFRSDVTSIAQDYDLAISRLQGNADGSLQLVFSDAAPNDVYLWLEEVSTYPGGEALRASLSVRDDKVQAVIDLQGTRP